MLRVVNSYSKDTDSLDRDPRDVFLRSVWLLSDLTLVE